MKNTPKITIICGTLSQELPVRHEIAGLANGHPALLVSEEGESRDPQGNWVYLEDRAERGPFLVFPAGSQTPKVGDEVSFRPNKPEDLFTPTGTVEYTVSEVIRGE